MGFMVFQKFKVCVDLSSAKWLVLINDCPKSKYWQKQRYFTKLLDQQNMYWRYNVQWICRQPRQCKPNCVCWLRAIVMLTFGNQSQHQCCCICKRKNVYLHITLICTENFTVWKLAAWNRNHFVYMNVSRSIYKKSIRLNKNDR